MALKLKYSTSRTAKYLKTTPHMVLKTAAAGLPPARLRIAVENGAKLQHIINTPDVFSSVTSDKQKAENLRNVLQTITATRRNIDPPEKQKVVYTFRCFAAAKLLGMNATGPFPMPRRISKYTVLKSPFKFKKHQETYEIRTQSYVVQAMGDPVTGKGLVDFIKGTTPAGCYFRHTKEQFYPADQFYIHPYLQETAALPKADIDYESVELPEVEVEKVTF